MSDDSFQQVFSVSPTPTLVYDRTSGHILEANEAALLMFGYTREEMLTLSLGDLRVPDAPGLPQVPAGARTDVARDVAWYRRSDGFLFPLAVASCELMWMGRDARVLQAADLSSVDVPESESRRLATRERLAAERRRRALRALLDEATQVLTASLEPDTIPPVLARLAVPIVADYCVIHGVDDGLRLTPLGCAHADQAQQPLLERICARLLRVPGPDDNVMMRAITTAEAQMEADYATCRNLPSFESPIAEDIARLAIVSVIAAPLLARGRVVGLMSMARCHGRERFDEGDLAFARDLGRRAAVALENARLYAEAREANRAKDDFIAALSHELRTPLNAIIGWAHMLDGEMIGESRRSHALAAIRRNAAVQMALIEDILDMSRIVAGRMVMAFAPVPLREPLAAAIEVVTPSAEAKQIQLNASLRLGDDIVDGDARRLQQVFWNLLSNAIKFTPPHGVVSVDAVVAAGLATVTVSDNGEGIPVEFLPRVFDRFAQVERSSRRQGGLGLGLAIARHIVQAHGGTVIAASDGPGCGSRFTVALPVRVAGSVPDSEPIDTANGTWLEGCDILLVDDDEVSAAAIAGHLRARGATVRAVQTAALGWAAFLERTPTIVLVDVAMPEEAGLELVARVRRLDPAAGGAVPAIAVTAYTREEDRARAMAFGFQGYVAKPIVARELNQAVRQLVRNPASSIAAVRRL